MVGTPHHLLVIDDEPFIGRIVRMQFERGPYKVSVAGDGKSGLDFLSQHADVDVILLDLNMPGVTGIEVLETVRRDEGLRHAAVVVLTAAGQIGQVERARDLGAAVIVTKPFSPKKLYRQIGELLGAAHEADLGGEGEG